MKVELIAHTKFVDGAIPELERQEGTTDAEHLIVAAGRNCYRSFHRPRPETAEDGDYVRRTLIEQAHESIAEHASATFLIEASRSVLTELERHRHLSFSVVSQRYVDASVLDTHVPPAIESLPPDDRKMALIYLEDAEDQAYQSYHEIYDIMTNAGFPRKQAREAARAVLPNMTSSPMVVTGNHRAWRYVIKARWHEAADAEIRELAGELLRQLREIAPNTYQDIPNQPYSY